MVRDSVEGTSTSSYYTVLGIPIDSSPHDIRQAYRKLAMQWHPDKWAKSPSQLGEAKLKFQQIQEAYSVLSDQSKRTMYDAGFYDPDEEYDEGFADFLQEMTSLMHKNRREDKYYSMNELQSMFWDMVQSFEFPEWPSSLSSRKIGSVIRSSQCMSLLNGFVGSSLLMIQEAQRGLEVRQYLFRKKVLTYRYKVCRWVVELGDSWENSIDAWCSP